MTGCQRRCLKYLVLLLALVPAWQGAAEGVDNGDFDAGLQGWEVVQSGGEVNPGGVVIEGGQAVLSEGDSFLVSLRQVFVLDRAAAARDKTGDGARVPVAR